MYTRIVRPERVSGEELDGFLAHGWYRIGQTLMTCRFVVYEGVLRSALWTRLPLDGHRYKKRLRRVLRKNGERFRHTVGPAQLDDQRQNLYARYTQGARGERPETLEQFLFGDGETTAFDTHEVAVWDEDRLVALGVYDLGEQSMQSLLGAYDPDYSEHSLGLYTMMLEIEEAKRKGLRYHYAGYVLPGESAMDYKLRVGALEAYDFESLSWVPYESIDRSKLPTRQLVAALHDAQRALTGKGVPNEIRTYPAYELSAYDGALSYCLNQPMFVECYPERQRDEILVLTWDLKAGHYQLLWCLRAVGRAQDPSDGEDFQLVVVYETLARDADVTTLAGLAASRS